jgi:hypothetical protein
LKSDFMVVSESKQKRESATDISDVIEAADSTKNYKYPALIQSRYSRVQERFMARQILALPPRPTELINRQERRAPEHD